MANLFYVIYPSALSDPSASQIATGWPGSATASGSQTSPTVSGDVIFAAAMGLSPSTSYKVAFVWYDGTNYSNVSVSSVFTTASSGFSLSADPAVYTHTGFQASMLRLLGSGTLFESASFSYAGQLAEFVKVLSVTASSASFIVSGISASLFENSLVVASPANFTISLQNVSNFVSSQVIASPTNFSLSGISAITLKNSSVVAAPTNINLSLAPVSNLVNSQVIASAGTFTLVGIDAPTPGAALTLDATAVSLTLSGSNASTLYSRYLLSSASSFSEVGIQANLLQNRVLKSDLNTFVESGNQASVLVTRLVVASLSSFIVTGTSVNLLAIRTLQAIAGSYSFTRFDAGLAYITGSSFIYPDPSNVRFGLTYGPSFEYVGTFKFNPSVDLVSNNLILPSTYLLLKTESYTQPTASDVRKGVSFGNSQTGTAIGFRAISTASTAMFVPLTEKVGVLV